MPGAFLSQGGVATKTVSANMTVPINTTIPVGAYIVLTTTTGGAVESVSINDDYHEDPWFVITTNGQPVSVMYGRRVETEIPSGSVIRLSFTAPPLNAFAAVYQAFSGIADFQGVASGSGGIATLTGFLPGDIAVGVYGANNADSPTGDTDTLAGTWSPVYRLGTSGQGAGSNNYVMHQYKVVNAPSDQSYSIFLSGSTLNPKIVRLIAGDNGSASGPVQEVRSYNLGGGKARAMWKQPVNKGLPLAYYDVDVNVNGGGWVRMVTGTVSNSITYADPTIYNQGDSLVYRVTARNAYGSLETLAEPLIVGPMSLKQDFTPNPLDAALVGIIDTMTPGNDPIVGASNLAYFSFRDTPPLEPADSFVKLYKNNATSLTIYMSFSGLAINSLYAQILLRINPVPAGTTAAIFSTPSIYTSSDTARIRWNPVGNTIELYAGTTTVEVFGSYVVGQTYAVELSYDDTNLQARVYIPGADPSQDIVSAPYAYAIPTITQARIGPSSATTSGLDVDYGRWRVSETAMPPRVTVEQAAASGFQVIGIPL